MANQNTAMKEPEPALKASAPVTGTATVSIACKLPHGLILRAFNKVEVPEAVQGSGYRTVVQSVPCPERFVIHGTALPFGQAPTFQTAGGYAITEGVPQELWERWYEDNKDSDVVRNNLIFASSKTGRVADEAKEHAEVRSGLEPLARKDDPRVPRSLNPALSEITIADRK